MKNFIKAITALTTAVMFIMSLTVTTLASPAQIRWLSEHSIQSSQEKFSDVPTSHWAYANIERITRLGYFSGYEDGTFKPDNQITHEEFLKVLAVYGLPANITSAINPANVELTNRWASWAQLYLNAALNSGIITTGDADLVTVNTPITRGEMAKLIARLREYLGRDDTGSLDLSGVITDWNTIPDEYKPYVAKAYNAGILNGYDDGSFKSDGRLTRAEASSVILSLIDEKNSTAASAPTPTIAENNDKSDLTNIKVLSNGEQVKLSIAPNIINNDVFVFVRDFENIFNMNMRWESGTDTFFYEKNGYGTYRFKYGSGIIEKQNGDLWEVCVEDVHLGRMRNITFMPLLAVAESLGVEVNYNQATNTVTINYAEIPEPTPEPELTITIDGTSVERKDAYKVTDKDILVSADDLERVTTVKGIQGPYCYDDKDFCGYGITIDGIKYIYNTNGDTIIRRRAGNAYEGKWTTVLKDIEPVTRIESGKNKTINAYPLFAIIQSLYPDTEFYYDEITKELVITTNEDKGGSIHEEDYVAEFDDETLARIEKAKAGLDKMNLTPAQRERILRENLEAMGIYGYDVSQ